MPFSGVEKEAKDVGSTSGRVGLHRLKGEPMAFDEHLIDQVNWLPAAAREDGRAGAAT